MKKQLQPLQMRVAKFENINILTTSGECVIGKSEEAFDNENAVNAAQRSVYPRNLR